MRWDELRLTDEAPTSDTATLPLLPRLADRYGVGRSVRRPGLTGHERDRRTPLTDSAAAPPTQLSLP